MARMILKWRYIKSKTPKHSERLVKYIATREGAEKCDESWKHQKSTDEQQRLIRELVNDFPDTKNGFEYQDYEKSKTKGAASEFINHAIEEKVDLIGKKENYIGYIAMRPRVEKQGSHGLFSQEDKPINLSSVAKEVANHKGTVWTTIISLQREDAEKLGYDNARAWRDMLRSQADVLANSMGIPMSDLRWYAAFHNESYHPHVHIVAYSLGKEPYMTEQGLKKMKSQFAKEIFKQDLYHIYDEQTQYRDELHKTSKEMLKDIVDKINSGVYENKTVEMMLEKLAAELENYTGKKVYGYLPKKAKNLINGIVDELEKDECISQLYELWYLQKDKIIKTYQDSSSKRIPLSQNKEFKSIRNAVIQEAFNLSKEENLFSEKHTVKTAPTESNTKKHYSNYSLSIASMQLFVRLTQILQDEIKKNDNTSYHIERKLRQKIEEKKLAHGQKMG